MLRLCVTVCGVVGLGATALLAGEKEFIASTGNAYQYRAPYVMKAKVYSPEAPVVGGRYVRMVDGMCAGDRERILDWAAGTSGYAAVAFPGLPEEVEADCSILNPNLRGGWAQQLSTEEAAIATAMARCEATKLDGYEDCMLVSIVGDGQM